MGKIIILTLYFGINKIILFIFFSKKIKKKKKYVYKR